MRALLFLTLVLPEAIAASAGTADEIMAQVAVNQDRAQRARSEFIYHQNVVVRLRDSHGRLVREEITDYHVTPHDNQTHKELVKFTGRYKKGASLVAYDSEQRSEAHDGFRDEADRDIAHDMREDLVGDRKSKDGLATELFPLTAKEQRKYQFAIKGEEKYRGIAVYRIAFEPKQNCSVDCDSGDTPWSGDALIGKADFQPVLITTKLAKKIPLFVRTALGTNLPGLGFSVEYRKFDDDVWFPVSYGTEFRVRAVFIYSRQISVSLVNSDFQRANVQTAVEFERVP